MQSYRLQEISVFMQSREDAAPSPKPVKEDSNESLTKTASRMNGLKTSSRGMQTICVSCEYMRNLL